MDLDVHLSSFVQGRLSKHIFYEGERVCFTSEYTLFKFKGTIGTNLFHVFHESVVYVAHSKVSPVSDTV
jgi:hypothetical protein